MKNENDIGPEDSCLICAQKHFLAAEGAIKEPGYEKSEKNHDFAIKELVLAAPHVQQDFPVLAQKIRDIRHYVQYWQYDKIGTLWDEVKHILNVGIMKELKIPAAGNLGGTRTGTDRNGYERIGTEGADGGAAVRGTEARTLTDRTDLTDVTDGRGRQTEARSSFAKATEDMSSDARGAMENMDAGKAGKKTIYIFSNVVYPESRKIQPAPGDMLVFLNKAASAGYYTHDRVIRFAYHRSQKKNYGEVIPGCINQYVFDEEKKGNGFPKEFIDRLKKDYDWNYSIPEEKDEEGKVKKVVKSMTTGYMVVKFLEEKYPNHKIVLVNFGYEVQKSTYRCPWHNWKFEAEELKGFEHIYLEESK